ncbi:Coenzyme F420 hydrogenase/dehydrogenase, beta subunit C-terminal domain [Thermodesulfatator atlanticus]|uniref:Coenzyme F420 hydrogenase/dehydrogenase, beta subunit C-terminal domain n=1 Tax=Thermodesulfatator atlanticus TaxID=501497 RepID=UPI0003B5F877|nr:Coenzyme F420 hydrogenase/dehydrogenase, beta subunit C-terminal domain [Thermodesulfatator atlanticus]
MKTFENLLEEVVGKGLCHRCGGCVSVCTAINYGALGFNAEGFPEYKDIEKCIECGICYMVCPEAAYQEDEFRKAAGWEPPVGPVLGVKVARAISPEIRQRATDGGVVTALLVHLLKRGVIDGAVVAKRINPFLAVPAVVTTPEEVIEAAGFFHDVSAGAQDLSHIYSTFAPSFEGLRPVMAEKLRRVAIVGTPCQIHTMRKMQFFNLAPSETFYMLLGLFCSGHFMFDESGRKKLEELGGFKWEQIVKINIKDALIIKLENGEEKRIPLSEIEDLKRPACKYCDDYAAEFADISFGGIGAPEGWTSVIIRTPKARGAFADARRKTIEEFPLEEDPKLPDKVLDIVKKATEVKKQKAEENLKKLHG